MALRCLVLLADLSSTRSRPFTGAAGRAWRCGRCGAEEIIREVVAGRQECDGETRVGSTVEPAHGAATLGELVRLMRGAGFKADVLEGKTVGKGKTKHK